VSESTLRSSLLWRLGAGVVLALLLDAVVCYFTALHFANLVYDRWLIDSVHSLAQALGTTDGRIEFQLSAAGEQVVLYDEVDQIYFRIQDRTGRLIAGTAALPVVDAGALNRTRFTETQVDGRPVRLVASRVQSKNAQQPVIVEVAETLIKRSTLTREILLAMVMPQIGILVIALLLAWFSIGRGLKPLTDLALQIEKRSHDNLAPVAEFELPREGKVLASRINELLMRLGEALRAQKRFVADAAHQLRTPLAAVLLYTESAKRAVDRESQLRALNALQVSAERAARLSQQLLSLARADPQASIAVNFQPIDLAALARTIGEEWIAQALHRDIDFGLVVPDAQLWVKGDAALIGELMSNLIDNAFRYGAVPGRITLCAQRRGHPQLFVEDDGPGIAPEERERVFERFYRPPGNASPGCGLGLSIVRDIASIHGAEVSLGAGDNGRGTRFTVVFAPLESAVA
jgi:two-component system sensor histidine kinase TctE